LGLTEDRLRLNRYRNVRYQLFSAACRSGLALHRETKKPSSAVFHAVPALRVLPRSSPVSRPPSRTRWARLETAKGHHDMATIGTFSRTTNGYNGSVKTLSLNVKTVKFVPAEGDNEKGPNFRIFAGATEFGAAWKMTSEKGRDYLSVKLDDPSFPAPIYASLVEVEGEEDLALIWSRRRAAE
jgi:uncharacterized protein (DUF736 family)